MVGHCWVDDVPPGDNGACKDGSCIAYTNRKSSCWRRDRLSVKVLDPAWLDYSALHSHALG